MVFVWAWRILACVPLTPATLTRRMVDVSQEVIVREIDCGTTDGLWVSEIHEGKEKIESFRERIIGRYAVGDVINPVTGEVIVPEGQDDRPVRRQ